MCKVLKISRSLIYYKPIKRQADNEITEAIIQIFKSSRSNYGTRKIKAELKKQGHVVSRRRIGRIMKENGLVSNYTTKQYKPKSQDSNEEEVKNEVNREFEREREREVVVSDLTYVRVGHTWHYICILIDLYNREIIGYSDSRNKDAQLVKKAFSKVQGPLDDISIFHTDRGSEFKNKIIDELLTEFDIKRSLSAKGTPYDNAVAEATYKVIKTEFINKSNFDSLEQLELELFDYVNWYNNIRIHGSLNYHTPASYAC